MSKAMQQAAIVNAIERELVPMRVLILKHVGSRGAASVGGAGVEVPRKKNLDNQFSNIHACDRNYPDPIMA